MVGARSNWEDELGGWLKPFLDRLGHKARRRMCPLYVAGLIGPGDRKSVQPMAERLAPGDYDQLHHFVACRRLGCGAAGGGAARSSGPARRWQRCGVSDRRYRDAEEGHALGRCRRAICLGTGQDRELPDTGVTDARPWRSAGDGGFAAIPSRQLDKRSGVVGASWCPGRISDPRTKPEIALAEIDRMISVGVRFRCVRCRKAEKCHDAVAQVLGDMAVVSVDDRGTNLVILL